MMMEFGKMKPAILLLVLFFGSTNAARADSGNAFFQVTCANALNYFEVQRKDISGTHGEDRMAAVAKQANLFVDRRPTDVTCVFDDGTKLRLVSEPNSVAENHLFPGARLSLLVNGSYAFRNLSFATDCLRSIARIEVDHNLDLATRLYIENSSEHVLSTDDPIGQLPTFGRIEHGKSYDQKIDPLRIQSCYER